MTEPNKETPLTLERFVEFYDKRIEPRFEKLEIAVEEIRNDLRTINGRFDDLYKKMETLHQEYVFICEQLRRLEEGQERIEKQTLPLLKEQISSLQKRVEILESRL